MRGYAGSGKSTKARDLASQSGAIIVSRDEIRKRIFGRYTNVDEDIVTDIETAEAKKHLDAGKSIIVDACHLQARYLKRWASLAAHYSADFDTWDLLTDVSDCIINDADIDRVRAGKHVGYAVILKQAKRWPQDSWPLIEAPHTFIPVPYDPPQGKEFAVIVDIDGTIAHRVEGGRSPFDYSRVREDIVDPCIREIVQSYSSTARVLLVSGREDTCREDTIAWLDDNRVTHDQLYMRKAGDFRNDAIVKCELFDEHIRDNYQVLFVLDDRDRVVKMWRSLGLKCLQVAEGAF